MSGRERVRERDLPHDEHDEIDPLDGADPELRANIEAIVRVHKNLEAHRNGEGGKVVRSEVLKPARPLGEVIKEVWERVWGKKQ